MDQGGYCPDNFRYHRDQRIRELVPPLGLPFGRASDSVGSNVTLGTGTDFRFVSVSD